MPTYRLISFIADDRPGLVEQLSEAIHAHGGNWLESRMSQLAGKFTGIVRLSVPSSRVDELEQALSGLERVGLTLRFESPASKGQALSGVRHQLEILGHDRPGILHEFAAALASRRINVADLKSEIRRSAMKPDPLFHASAAIELPPGLDVDELRRALESIARELDIEYSLAVARA